MSSPYATEEPNPLGRSLGATRTMACGFDEQTELSRPPSAHAEEDDDRTLRGPLIPEEPSGFVDDTAIPAQKAETMLPVGPPAPRYGLWALVASVGIGLGILTALLLP